MYHKRQLKNMIWMVSFLIHMNQKVNVQVEWVSGSMRVISMNLDEIQHLRNELANQGITKLKKLHLFYRDEDYK